MQKFKTYVINIKRPEIGRYLRGESDDVVAAAQGVAREFASVGLSRPEAGRGVDQSRYAGIGDNAASISSREIQQSLKFDRDQYQQQMQEEDEEPSLLISNNMDEELIKSMSPNNGLKIK